MIVRGCDPYNTNYVNHTAKVVSVEKATETVKRQIGGTVKIISGCIFQIRNATLIPTGNSAYWYAIPTTNNSDLLPRVVVAALSSYNGQTITFHLDTMYEWSDIAVMIMWGENDNRAYGAFAVNSPVEAYFNDTPPVTFNPGDPTDPFSSGGTEFVKKGNLCWGLLVTFLLFYVIG